MHHSSTTSRRQFLSLCGAAALAALPLRARAQAAAKLDPKEPIAVSLAYVEDVASIDPAKTAGFKPGSDCANCRLYAAAQEKDGYAPCMAVGNKLVAGAGWCRAWVG